MSFKKIVIGILAAIGLLYLLMIVYANLFVDCHHVSSGVAGSPDGKYIVEHYVKVCESEPPIIQVLVGEKNSSTRKLVFSAIATSTLPIRIEWRSGNELQISHARSIEPTTADQNYDHVRISYSNHE